MGRWGSLTRISLIIAGEPLRWAIPKGQMPTFLEQSGFRVLGPPERFDLRARYLEPEGIGEPVGAIEQLAVAEFA